jgi:hypothetical protein
MGSAAGADVVAGASVGGGVAGACAGAVWASALAVKAMKTKEKMATNGSFGFCIGIASNRL